MSSRSEKKQSDRPRRRLLKWSLGTLAALVILAAVLVGLFRVAANVVPGYHDEIEQRISAQIGAPVELGKVSLVWHGWGPALVFNEVRILNQKTGNVVLGAERLRLDFALLSLVHGLDARPYAIHLEAPTATLRQMPDGSIVLPGLSFSSAGTGGLEGMLDTRIGVENGRITLRLADQPSLQFTSIDLSVSGGKEHEIHLALQLPAELGGQPLYVDGQVTTRGAEPEQWGWTLRYALQQVPLAAVDSFLPADWNDLHGLVTLRGKAQGVGGELQTADGALTLAFTGGGEERLKSLRTRYALELGPGYALTLKDSVLVGSQHTWQPGKIGLLRDESGRMHVSVVRLDLDLLAPAAGLLPASLDSVARRLQTLQATGTIGNLAMSWAPGRIGSLSLHVQLHDVGLRPVQRVPGVGHLSGRISMHHGMGVFQLDAPGLTLYLPGIYPHPVELDRVQGRIGIALTAEAVRVAVPRLEISGAAGLEGWAMAKIDVPDQGPVSIRLAATVPGEMDAMAARSLYTPASLLPEPLVHWLMTQLEDGWVGHASMRFVGPAMQFPFYEGQGLFSVRFDYGGVTLKPGMDWAPLRSLGGSIHFKNEGMSGEVSSGKIVQATVRSAKVVIPDLAAPVLHVSSFVTGSMNDFITFLKKSPVSGGVDYGFEQFEIRGEASTRVQLTLPVMRPDEFDLSGRFTIEDAKLKLAGRPYWLRQLHGLLRFDRFGPRTGHLEGRLFDTPIAVELARKQGDDDDKLLLIVMRGDFPVKNLAGLIPFDLKRYVTGRLPVRAGISVPLTGGGLPVDISLTSNLQGLAVDLPAPAGKPAQAREPLMLSAHVTHEGVRLKARYADVVSFCTGASYRGKTLEVPLVEVKLGEGWCQLPHRGYRLVGGWPVLRTREWLDAASPVVSSPAASSPTAFSGMLFGSAHDLSANVHFGRINLFGRGIQDQSIVAWLFKDQLKVQLKGPDLTGTLLMPRSPDNRNPILVHLQRAHFSAPLAAPTAAPSTATASAPAAATRQPAVAANEGASGDLHPRDIPPFDLHVSSLEFGQAVFKGVEVSARRVPGGIVIKPIHVDGGVLSLDGQLVWLRPDTGSQGALQMLVHVNELGTLLQGFGMGKIITGHGNVSAAMAWNKPPAGGEFAEGLLGKVSMDLREGNIAQVNAGAGKLLSLLNLANIPRYLVFDFHSLFGEGFPFSRIYGDYHIKNGIARTKAFRIDSSVADIKLVGTINVVQGTIDQIAYVRPNYFGSLPVIGAILGGLGWGAAIFVLAKIFGNPIGKALQLVYHIVGPITDPRVVSADEYQPQNQQKAPAAASAGAP
ncbi:MAG: TIGR02099 family protein [Gammaproteobacteria bacterium]|nr:TIGR02099 family protein [Gammaproteobacteria bacterium]